MHGIKILVGDIAELSPTKMSTLDDLDLEKCTVLEVNDDNTRIKVVFNNNNAENETYFDNESTIDSFSTDHLIDIERDYKIIKITDNQDTVTNQPVTIVTMAKVIKEVNHTQKGYIFTGAVSEADTDVFIFVGVGYNELAPYLGTVNRISFSNFRMGDAFIDGSNIQAWYATAKIADVEDIFTLP